MRGWPDELAPIGAIRFARRSSNFEPTVSFYRDLIGLPLLETFENSYGNTGAIFGMPNAALTFEIVQAVDDVPVDHHDQLCLYFPDQQAMHAATARLKAAGVETLQSHHYWVAMGATTYRDPDGREVVFAPFIDELNEPATPDDAT